MRLFSSGELPSAAPRILKVDVGRLHIKGYDIDNGYPQRMETMINASPTAKQAVAKLARFITGQGFDKDQDVWNYVVNAKGETADELLEQFAKQYAKFNGACVHINYNALFQGVELNIIPFKYARIGMGEMEGKIAVSTDWWNNDKLGQYVRKDKIDYIDRFNPDPVSIKKQVSEAGGWKNYKGQVFYWTEDGDINPLATCDAVLDSIEAEILAGQTSKNNIRNNFGDKVIWMQPEGGRADADGKEQMSADDLTEGLQNLVGPDGPQLVLVEFKTDADKPVFQFIENKLDDKKFQFTIENSRGNIYRNYDQPAILHSDLTAGRYNQNQLPEAMKYYNNNTEPNRIAVQRAFKKLFSIFPNITGDFSITPLEDMGSATDNTEGANSSTPITDVNNQD